MRHALVNSFRIRAAGNSARRSHQREEPLKFRASSAMVGHVNQSASIEEEAPCHFTETRKALEPCSIVIFGASGDLTSRKLIPALYHLSKEKQMPPDYRIVGFARREKTDDSWREELQQALAKFSRTKPVDDAVWEEFSRHINYLPGDLTEASA